MTPAEIIAEFIQADSLPREALLAARRCEEEIKPLLVQIIERCIELQFDATEEDESALIFALFLLAEFKATEQFPCFGSVGK
ncbi:DUF1186 domain-containing protein [Magnetofaba australis]|uniref:Uncharacterized protein n=1 Tax=Magnetofaba australis IT-1 TaxID=1434232 RepID=A0A1Y2K652_9PROT|nr:DUF1186 domain-containing protein [Magnetofaba australis]OSM02594.1 hypothetical protein MAIT1_05419 [Magnetofaba australis IT-1]